jgi:hypothetical protein
MKKLTALVAALFALAMVTGTAMAAETMGEELRDHLSPNIFEYSADGVTVEEFGGLLDKHYGVAPVWEGRTEESLTAAEKAEIELNKHLAPNIFEFNADGVSVEEFRGIDTYYGVAPAWEEMTEEPLEKELRNHLAPNVYMDETSVF